MHPLNENGQPMHPKTPSLNGWKYLSINLHITEHKEYYKKMEELKELTGKNKKILWKECIDNRLKLEREKNEQGDHNTNTA